MRKRQFKKVLSLVLALAMVFSMNTSVFATGNVDAPVVETQTETQPETPVNNETENPAPAEEPAIDEQPAVTEPVAESEPPAADTTPEPAAEAAPAPEAVPEPVAGAVVQTADTWTVKNATGDGDLEDGDATFVSPLLTLKVGATLLANGAVGDTPATTLAKDAGAASVPAVTLQGVASSYGKLVVPAATAATIAFGGDTLALKKNTTYSTAPVAASDLDENDEILVVYTGGVAATQAGGTSDGELDFETPALDGNYKYYSTTAPYAEYETVTAIEDAVKALADNGELTMYRVKTADGSFSKVKIKKIAAPDPFGADGLVVGSTSVKIKAAAATDGCEYIVKDSSGNVKGTAAMTGAEVTVGGLTANTTYTIQKRTASDNTAARFATEWSTALTFTTGEYEVITNGEEAKVNSYFDLTNGQYVTVSGVKISAKGNLKGFAVSDNENKGIFTVTLSSGTAVLTGATDPKPVSFNAPAGTGFIYADSESDLPGNKVSFYGEGTVSFNSDTSGGDTAFDSGSSIFFIKNTVKLSTNTAGKALVVSENSGNKYLSSIYGKEAPVSVTTESKPKIYIATADSTEGVFAENLDTNIVTVNSSVYVLSENMTVMKQIGAGDIDLDKKAKDKDAVYYGKTVFFADNATLTSNLKYKTLKNRYPNEMPQLEFFPGNVTPEAAYFNEPKGITATQYLFTVSTVNAVPAVDQFKKVTKNYAKNGYGLDGTHLAGGLSKLSPGTKYYVFALSSNGDSPSLYYSEAKKVGEFETKAEQKLEIQWNGSNIYYGGQNPAKGDAISAGNISVAFGSTGYTIKENNSHQIMVYDPADEDLEVGQVYAYVYTKDQYTANAAKIRKAKTHEDDLPVTIGTDCYTKVEASNASNVLKDLVSGNGYYIKTFFVPYEDNASYGEVSSNLISFNVVAAPITVNAQPMRAAVNTYLNAENLKEDFDEKFPARLTYKNTITNEEKVLDGEFNATGAQYTYDGKLIGTADSKVSINSAGTYKYSISSGTIKVTTPGAGAKYTITGLTDGKLSIFGEVNKDSFTLALADVFFGENKGSILGNAKVTYNNGADAAKKVTGLTESDVEFYKSVSADGTVSPNSPKYTVNVETLEAGTEVYAAVKVPAALIVAKDAKDTTVVSKFTVKKRPVSIVINNAANIAKFASKRNIEIKGTVSGGKASGESTTTIFEYKEQLKTAEDHTYSNTSVTATDVLSENATFDMSAVNITKDGLYEVPLSNVVLKTPQAKNFEVKSATGKYVIEPAWYAYYILEYGGHSVKTGHKTVKMDAKYADNGDGTITWQLPKELQYSTSFDKVITGDKDKVIAYESYDTEHHAIKNFVAPRNTRHTLAEMSAAPGVKFASAYRDIYFYAIVEAYATENVAVESIVPVQYDGNKHILNIGAPALKASNGQNKDITLTITDKSKNTGLQYGRDYTATVKNNTNASVYYDKSTSASNNTGDKGAVTQLFTEAKRPQVVITGKGDYKGMKATVYFDILPINIAEADNKDAGALKVKPNTGDVSKDYNHLKLGKKGGITYKYKVTDTLWINTAKNGEVTGTKAKNVVLSAKDYDETFVKATEHPNVANAYKVLGTDAKTSKAAAKAVSAKDKDYAVILKGKGNYYGEIIYPINVIDSSTLLLSELGWKTTKVAYKASGVSSGSAKGDFNLKATKKVNKKTLVYGTDFTAEITRNDGDTYAMGDGKDAPKNLAVYAGNYTLEVKPGATLQDLAKSGAIILDETKVAANIKSKKLNANMFTVTSKTVTFTKNKTPYSGKDIDDIEITASKVKAGVDFVELPKSFTANNGNYYAYSAAASKTTVTPFTTKLGESIKYLYYDTTINAWQNSYGTMFEFNQDGVQTDKNKWVYTFNASNAVKNHNGNTLYGNSRPGVYTVTVIGKGQYAGETAAVTYTVEGVKLDAKKASQVISSDKCYVNVNGTTTDFSMKLPFKVKARRYNSKTGAWEVIETDIVKNTDETMNGTRFFTRDKWSGNTKMTDAASVTITPTTYSGYLTKPVKVKFKIDTRLISSNEILSENAFTGAYAQRNMLYVHVDDKLKGSKPPVVKVYQAKENGDAGKEIKQKADYQFTDVDTGKISGNTIKLMNGTNKKANFKFDDKVLKTSLSPNKVFYDVYSTKAKSWTLTLSDNVYWLSANKVAGKPPVKVPVKFKELNSKLDSGTLVYNGKETLYPVIQNLTVDGVEVIKNGQPAGKGVSAVVSPVSGKVGTNKYTIKLVKDSKGYVLGGSKVYSIKVIPQDGLGLVLEK